MPLQAPNLDDRRQDQIVADAKLLIPRYAPEWTDHNASDPGITLLQLFAWMAEMTLYRLNQVPERNYIKFLQLLGIELEPARPARTELTFALARDDVETVIVPAGTQVAVSNGGSSDQGPLVFETDSALIALGAALAAIQSFDGFSYSVETTKNGSEGQWFYPFGPRAREGSALLLGFDSPIEFTDEQINLAFYLHRDPLTYLQRNCVLDLDRIPTPATLEWEYWDQKHWEPLSLDKDDTRAFSRSGHITLRGPGSQIKKDSLGNVEDPLYWLRARLVRSTYEQAPRLDMVLTNTVGATQATTVRDEILGGSSGRPSQVFRLANLPVIVRDQPETVQRADEVKVTITSLRLEVDEGLSQGYQVWQEVEDFFASRPDDPHYVLNRTTGEVRFGDGEHGRIPVANPGNPHTNVVARLYRYGGGRAGNTGADTITELQSFVEGIAEVTNLRAAEGGTDEESVEEAKLRAPQELKSKNRAVTAEDFEILARQTPGTVVRRAKALPLVHPEYTGAIPGVITVIVVPDSDAPNPLPNETTLAAVCQHLNCFRLLTSEVHVVGPTYHLVSIEAEIVVNPADDLAVVKRAVEDRLTRYFDPLVGDEDGMGWPFGGDIFYSEVYRVVLQTPGVDRILNNNLNIWLDNERQTFCRDVPIATGHLLYTEGHQISVSYSTRD